MCATPTQIKGLLGWPSLGPKSCCCMASKQRNVLMTSHSNSHTCSLVDKRNKDHLFVMSCRLQVFVLRPHCPIPSSVHLCKQQLEMVCYNNRYIILQLRIYSNCLLYGRRVFKIDEYTYTFVCRFQCVVMQYNYDTHSNCQCYLSTTV